MTNDTHQEEASPPQEEAPPKIRTTELTRATTDNMIAGVAEGLARRTGIGAIWIRLGFVLFAFAGGLGFAAYLALWALIPADNEPDSIAQRFFSRTTSKGSWLGVGLIFVAILILLDNVRFLSGGIIWAVGLLAIGYLLYTGDLPRLIKEPDEPKEGVQQMTTTTTQTPEKAIDESDAGAGFVQTPPPPPPTPTPPPPIVPAPTRETSVLGRLTLGVVALALGIMALFDTATDLVNPAARHYIALAVTILGVGLIVGAFIGRARWLILIGVMTLPFLFSSPGLEYDFNGTSGGTVYVTPEDFGDLALSYEQGIGELVIDLRELPWGGQTIPLDARVDIGQLIVIVPDTVEVSGTGETAIGFVEFERQQSAGLGSEITFEQSGSDINGSVELVASVGIGHLEIDRRSTDN